MRLYPKWNPKSIIGRLGAFAENKISEDESLKSLEKY
jgi:hypothetical protein